MIEKSISFVLDLITNPNVKDNKFDSETFKITKKCIHDILISEKESPSHYSFIELMKLMDSDSPISYNADGYLDDLDKIDESNLYDYYKELIKTNLVDIFIIGDIDNNQVKQIFNDKFNIAVA